MNDKLRDAIDRLEAKLERGELIDYTDDEELKAVREAGKRHGTNA